jgi:hypothetical protein
MRENRKRQSVIVSRKGVFVIVLILWATWRLTTALFYSSTSKFISELQQEYQVSNDGMASTRRPRMNSRDNLQTIYVIFHGSTVGGQSRFQKKMKIVTNDKLSTLKRSRRRVIVGFPFFREFETLRERLELYDEYGIVDCVIIAESRYSHRGNEKPFYLREAVMNKKGAYKVPWLNKTRFYFKLISVIDDSNFLSDDNLWGQEYQSRRIIQKGLSECAASDDDLILISDADEILDSVAIQWLQNKLQHGQVAFVDLRWYLYNKCWLHPRPTQVAVAVTYRTLQDVLMGDPQNIRRAADFFSENLTGLYYYDIETGASFAGNHCSWCFGNDYDAFRDKVDNGNPGDGGDLWYNISFSNKRIKHLMENGLWFDGTPHGENVCT